MSLRVGFSTCPNDTFACHAILERKIDLEGLDLDIDFLSVQELNERLSKGLFDFSKASSHAALHLSETYGVLRAGASMGIGSGPLLLAAKAGRLPDAESLVLCPGRWTTGTLLLRCLHPDLVRIEHRPFSQIVPALRAGAADFGVVIHEGRFTYQKEGLSLVSDFGILWERISPGPLPLGLILGKRDLPSDLHKRFHKVLLNSIQYALANREEALPTVQRFAQELDEGIIWSYLELYVNRYTLAWDDTAEQALTTLERLAKKTGVLAPAAPPVTFIG